MRILANYGYKNNGDSYSVTFETTGDVPMEMAPDVVDDLFRQAKEAIQRQVQQKNGNGGAGHYQKENGNGSSKKGTSANDNGYRGSKNGGNGSYKNGDSSNGAAGKISQKQMQYIYDLLKEKEGLIGNDATAHLKSEFNVQYVRDLTHAQADQCIQMLLNG